MAADHGGCGVTHGNPTRYHRPTIAQQIITDTALAHGLTVHEMLNGQSKGRIEARWAVMAQLRSRGYSGPHIAFLLGLKDHTTVYNGVRRFNGGEPRVRRHA